MGSVLFFAALAAAVVVKATVLRMVNSDPRMQLADGMQIGS